MQVLSKGDASQISPTQHAQGEKTYIKWVKPSLRNQEVNIIERCQTYGDFKSNPTLGGRKPKKLTIISKIVRKDTALV